MNTGQTVPMEGLLAPGYLQSRWPERGFPKPPPTLPPLTKESNFCLVVEWGTSKWGESEEAFSIPSVLMGDTLMFLLRHLFPEATHSNLGCTEHAYQKWGGGVMGKNN